MSGDNLDQTRTFWDNVADDWRIQVGDDGDGNRRLNSDPVLWKFLGDVDGLPVLDAGCGTGYLAAKLRDRGARVTGIDFSDRMLGIARSLYVGIDFRLDSCSELHTLADEQFDAIVANYVLMDTPDIRGTMRAFSRVLKPGGLAVVVFSHPCFPQGRATRPAGGTSVSYGWEFPYFSETKRLDPPWAHFTSEFIWFHRPLSDYWKAFTSAGFGVEDFEEPRMVITSPSAITGTVAGTSKAGVMNLEFPYHMTERNCDGTVKMTITLPEKLGPSKGTMETAGCGDSGEKVTGTVELKVAAAKPATK